VPGGASRAFLTTTAAASYGVERPFQAAMPAFAPAWALPGGKDAAVAG